MTSPRVAGHSPLVALAFKVSEQVQVPSDLPSVSSSDELIASHATRVYRSLRYLGVLEQELSDACQEVFLVMHRRHGEFRGDSKYETWVYGICVGTARNVRRGRRRALARVSDEEPEEVFEPTFDEELDLQRTRARLNEALEQLSEDQREVFVLHEVEELKMNEVARTVGCPLFTAYSRYRLGRRKLRKLLEPMRKES